MLRFIPVGAGNSRGPLGGIALMAVYPRGCGELIQTLTLKEYRDGLSPWVRGTQLEIVRFKDARRFIPVGAGNSPTAPCHCVPVAVYPRGCGELPRAPAATSSICGLSPWVRGTPRQPSGARQSWRFIPVGAGNSYMVGNLLSFGAVYPRGCGELIWWWCKSSYGCGLSPWVRGTLTDKIKIMEKDRFIPVGAGNSHGLL